MQDLFFFASKNIVLISAWLFSLIILIFYFSKSMFLKYKVINNIQAIKLINQDKAIIVDTRTTKMFQKGHILNSINIPLEDILSENFNQLQKYKMFALILVINHTYEYNQCVKKILKNGYNDVYILKNGLCDWNLNHLPLCIKEINNK